MNNSSSVKMSMEVGQYEINETENNDSRGLAFSPSALTAFGLYRIPFQSSPLKVTIFPKSPLDNRLS